jgi:hypothetical protein
MKSIQIQQLALALLCATLSYPGPAWAATYSCTGKVDQVATSPAGEVNASFSFQTGGMAWQRICNTDAVINGVPLPACKAVLATLMMARQSQQNVTMWFDNSTGGNCNATPWRSISEMGWYWGPSL